MVENTEQPPPRDVAEDIALALRTLRTAAGLSQKELADMVGIAVSNISCYERGERVPKLRTLQRIADAMSIDMSRFLDFDFAYLRTINNSSVKRAEIAKKIAETRKRRRERYLKEREERRKKKAEEKKEEEESPVEEHPVEEVENPVVQKGNDRGKTYETIKERAERVKKAEEDILGDLLDL